MKPHLLRGTWVVTATLTLGAVFMAYLNPHRAVELANMFWACF